MRFHLADKTTQSSSATARLAVSPESIINSWMMARPCSASLRRRRKAATRLPCLHVVVNNFYLGLIHQAQRGFEMDFEVSLAFENINMKIDEELAGYAVDHVAEGLGCQAMSVNSANEFKQAFADAKILMAKHQLPVVIEFLLEKVTNIAMGTALDNVNEFDGALDVAREMAPAE